MIRPARDLLKAAVPWLVAAGVLAYLFHRVPLAEVRAALAGGPFPALAAFALFEVLLLLPADALALRAALRAARIERPLGDLLLARGATYLLGLVSYAAGQGGIGYYLARTGVGAARGAGVVLFLLAANGICLVLVAAVGLPVAALAGGAAVPGAGAFVALALAAVVLYLAALAVPGLVGSERLLRLARRAPLAPLFEAGVRGHLAAVAARLPHLLLLVLVQWAAFRVWGLPVPALRGLALMPLVVFVAAMPLTPGGLGTSQAIQVLLYSPYSPAATAAGRAAALLGFALVHHAFGLASQALVGLACLVRLRRREAHGAAGPLESAP